MSENRFYIGFISLSSQEEDVLARDNYSYQKHQKALQKKKKRAEKQQKKQNKKNPLVQADTDHATDEGDTEK
jgi:hypothetical protein